MNLETSIQNTIRATVGSRPDVRLFRNEVGGARRKDGSFVEYGLCTGSPDLIGWRSVTVTPNMVGRLVAVFVAIEVKTPTGRPTPEQQRFLAVASAHGALAGIARSVQEAKGITDAL